MEGENEVSAAAHISEEEAKSIEELRNKVADLQHPRVANQHFLKRCLRARQGNIKKAETYLRNTIAWRTQIGADSILEKRSEFANAPRIKEFQPHCFHGYDKLGRPIYIEQTGQLQIGQLLQLTTVDQMVQYHIFFNEYIQNKLFPRASERAGVNIDQLTTIVDLRGLGGKHLKSAVYSFVQQVSKIDQDNYPEILGHMFVINAPMIFTAAWSMIRPWLDAKTVSKIQILGKNYMDALKQHIDEENIPTFLGGRCALCDDDKCHSSPQEKEYLAFIETGDGGLPGDSDATEKSAHSELCDAKEDGAPVATSGNSGNSSSSSSNSDGHDASNSTGPDSPPAVSPPNSPQEGTTHNNPNPQPNNHGPVGVPF